MKKIIVFYIIFSFIFLNFRGFVFAQNTETNIQEIKLERLECKLPPPIKEEEEISTSSYEYVNPMESFSAEGVKENKSWLNELGDFVKGLVLTMLADFFSGLIQKVVPTVAGRTDNAIAQSIKESTKNVIASIRTAISLALKDSLYYLQYKIISTILDKLHKLIAKHIIPDISAYKDLRIFLAYLRIVSKIIDSYKAKNGCIPKDLEGCMEDLVLALRTQAEKLSNRNPKLTVWINIVFGQIEKKVQELYCEETAEEGGGIEEGVMTGIVKPSKIVINPNKIKIKGNKISFFVKNNYIKANIGSINQPMYFSIIDKNGNEIQKLYIDPKDKNNVDLWNINEIVNSLIKEKKKSYSLKIKACILNRCKLNNLNLSLNIVKPTKFSLASIFNPFKKVLSLKALFSKIPFLAQTYYEETEEETYGTNEYPIPNVQKTEEFLNRCAILTSDIGLDIQTKLQKEIEKLNIFISAGGGFFTEQVKCLVTWKKEDQELANKGEITGYDPRCQIPGPTLGSPEIYKKIALDQIVSGEIDIFKNKEGITNLLVAYIRSWLDSKLYNIIDKGFASLEAKLSGKGNYASDVLSAYSPEEINKICERSSSATEIVGFKENCKSVLQSQGALITKALQNEYVVSYTKKINNLLNYVNEASSAFADYISKIKFNLDTITSTNISQNKIKELENILSELQNKQQELMSTVQQLNIGGAKNIFEEFASTTKEIDKSPTSTKLSSITNQIENLEKEIGDKKAMLEKNLYDLTIGMPMAQEVSQAFAGNIRIQIIKEEDGTIKVDKDSQNLKSDYIINKGSVTQLDFYKYFYPDYINKLNVDRYKAENQCQKQENNTTTITYYACPDLLIAYDLSRISNILWGKPSLNEKSFIEAFQSKISDIIQGKSRLSDRDYEKLNDFFNNTKTVIDNIEKNISNNQQFLDTKFRNYYSPTYEFTIGEFIEFLKKYIENISGVLNTIKDTTLMSNIAELNKLKAEADKYQNWIDEQYDTAWKKLISNLNSEELNNLSYALEVNKEKAQEIAEDSYYKCQYANDLIDQIEAEINASLYEEKTTEEGIEEEYIPEQIPAPEEEMPGAKGIIKTIFASIKNFIGNIFRIFIKPKGIYLK